MKIILLLLLSTLIFSRLIEIYPTDGSKNIIMEIEDEEIIDQMILNKIKIVDITNQKIIPQNPSLNFPDQPSQQTVVNKINSEVTKESLKQYLDKLCSHPHRMSRRAGSELSIKWITETVQKIIDELPTERKKLFKVTLVPVPGYIANSIIVTFNGSYFFSTNISSLVNENVIIGAHADDVGHQQAGADDNGSGTVTIMEAFRVIAKSSYLPKRTIEFMFYSAEESGLIGSRLIANQYKSRNKKVHAVLNHDMVGYHRPNTSLEAYLVNSQTNSNLNSFLLKLVKEYSGIKVTNYNRGYGSDHISWNNAGYASTCWKEFYFSPQYHQATDKVQHINFDLVREFTKVAISFAIELSA
jgi:bacterial leucyl aminopeptidase